VGLSIVAALLGVVAAMMYMLVRGMSLDDLEATSLGMIAAINTGAFLAAAAFGWILTRLPLGVVFPWKLPPTRLVLGLLLTAPGLVAVLNVIVAGLLSLPGTEWMEDLSGGLLEELTQLMLANRGLAFAVVVIMAPITEETFFRGLLLGGFSRRYSPRVAILAAALFFAVFHGNPIQFIPTLALGVYFGWLRLASGSLVAPVLAHALNNLTVLLAVWSDPDAAMSDSGEMFPPVSIILAAVLVVLLGLRVVRGSLPARDQHPG